MASISAFLPYRRFSTLTTAGILIQVVFILLFSCSADDPVRDYFKSHGMDYPADVSGIDLLSIDYVGIGRDELSAPGAREFVEDGITFTRDYFKNGTPGSLMPGINAIIISKPVLFRDNSGEAGLMVKVTGFGTGEPISKTKLNSEWVGKDKSFWKVENFAYFNRDDFYKWKFGGWVY